MNISLGKLIHEVAKERGIEPRFLAAVISQESSGNPFTVRYEPVFYSKYLSGKALKDLLGKFPENISVDVELRARSSSWGLMQIMGQTAREKFFDEPLWNLLEPKTNLSLGSLILSNWLKRFDIKTALLHYNGGGDKLYPDRVLAHLSNGNVEELLDS